ncbi:unnamed protein product [Closterium sp. NIES-53]
MFDESVPFYRLFPYRSAPPPPPPLFLAPGPLPIDPLPPQGPAPSGVSQVDPLLGTVPVEVAIVSRAAGGAASGGAAFGGAEIGGAEPRGAESEGVESGGAELGGAEPGGAEPGGGEPEGVELGGAESEGAGAGDPMEPGVAGAGGTGAGGTSAGGAGAGGARAGGAGAAGDGGTGAGGTSQPPLQPASPLPAPSPYSEQIGGHTKRRELESCPASPVCTGRRFPRPRPPPVPGTHAMALRPSSVPLLVPLPAPPESTLLAIPDPESDGARAASPTVSRLLATVVTDPSFESTTASALVAELLYFAATCPLEYATALVAETESTSPPSIGGEFALGTDVLEDRQEDFECLAGALPRFASMVLAPEGDPDAPDIPDQSGIPSGPLTPPRTGMPEVHTLGFEPETFALIPCTYVDPVPPSRVNIVDGMWIFRVKRPPGSPPPFKARAVAQGFSQRQGVDYFQTFSPTPKMTTLRVLLHIGAQRDYELLSLDFSTAFLQGSLHEEIWLLRPPGFTGSFPAGTQFSLRRPVYGLRQAPREWHDKLRTTLVALGFSPSTPDPSLFLCICPLLPPFYVLVYVLHRFGFQFSSPQRTPVSTGRSLSAPPSDESVEPSGPYPELVGCLMYLMTCGGPDLAYPLSLLARYVAPGRHRKVHWDAAKRFVRYLCSTSGMGLVLGGRGQVVLTGHADTSWSTHSSSVLSSCCEAEIYAKMRTLSRGQVTTNSKASNNVTSGPLRANRTVSSGSRCSRDTGRVIEKGYPIPRVALKKELQVVNPHVKFNCTPLSITGDRAGQTCGKAHTQHRSFSRLDDACRAEFGDEVERPHWAELLRSDVVIFDLDYDAILSAMYALSASAEGDFYRCEPPHPGIDAAALGASESSLPGTAPAEALHTFTLDSGASRRFFRDSTNLSPLPSPVPVRLPDPSRGPVVARSSTVLPCPAVPSGSLSGLHLPSFSTNLVSTAALQDSMVTTTTLGAQALYDAVIALYSSPATAALGKQLLPYLFPELSDFATIADLVTHLRTSDARYHATVPDEFLDTNQPPMLITFYFIVSRLPDSLRSVRDHFLSLDPTSLTVDLLEQHLLVAENSAVAVGAAHGTPHPPFFEGCSPSPLSPFFASSADADVSVTEDVGAASTSAKRRISKGKGGRGGGGGSGGGGGGSGSGGGGSGGGGGGSGGGGGGGTGGGSGGTCGGGGGSGGSGGSGGGGTGGGRSGPRRGGPGGGQRQQQQRRSETQSPQQLLEWLVHCGTGGGSESCPYVIRTGARAGQTCRKFHTEHRCFSRLDDAWRVEFGNDVECPRLADLLRSGVAIFDLDYDVIISAMDALSFSAEGDYYQCVPPDPGIAAAALCARASGTTPGTTPAEALHTFTLDSGASRCFFRDSTTLTPLPARVPVRLADPSGGPVVARSSTVLPCLAVPFGSLSGLHLPSLSTNLVSATALQDAMVTTTTPGGQRVSICTCTQTGRHMATFTRRPGSSLYTLATEPPQTLLRHHRLGHPSLPRLHGMHSRFLVSGLPRSLPPIPPSPAPSCLPCVEGRQRAAPHSSSFPSMTAPLQTLHMDVWGPARVSGQDRERYFLLVVDDYTRGGEFSSDLLHYICRGEGITQSFMLPDSPQQNGIAERRIGLVMEVARTSMIHAAAPHFLWPFAVRYAVHQLNLWPRVSLPETSPTLRWTGKVGDASVFRFWGSRAFVRDTSADKLSARAIPCVFLGFVPDAHGWQFYHPTSHRVLLSQDDTFDESIPSYRLLPYHSAPPPPTPLFLAPGPPPIDPLLPQGPAPSGVSQVDPLPGTTLVQVAVGSGAAPGAASGGATSGGAEPGGAGSEGARSGGAEHGGCAAVLAGAGGTGGAAATGPQGARTSRAGAAGSGGVGCAGAVHPTEPGAAGTRGAGAGGVGVGGPGTGGAGAARAGVKVTGAGGSGPAGSGAVDPGAGGAGGTVRPRPYFIPQLQQVLGVPSSTGLSPPFLCPPPNQSQPPLHPASPLPAPSPYTEQSGGLTELREPSSRPVSPVRTTCRAPCSRPPPVPGTHTMAFRPSSVPLRVPLLAPPESSLPEVPDPAFDRARAASPTISRLLATAITDPSFESAAASALVAELLDFAAACRLDYPTALVAESVSASPSSVGGECALGTDVLEDRQEDFECLAAAVPRFASMLLAPGGDPDAPHISTPRSYAEAITDPYSSQWQAAMDAKMASWKVKRTPGSPPAFKARYVAQGFSQRQGVDYFQTFSPTPKMTTLRVLLHVTAQHDCELHSLDFSTPFLQGSLHEEIRLRRPPGFTGTFPAGTQWSLRRPVYNLHQAPREWHDTLRTTLAALGFAPSTADPLLFLRTDTSVPPFYVLVYVDDLVFATADTEALTLVNSELQKRHTCTDLGEVCSYLGLQITRDRARRTITLTQSHMVHQVLQCFCFQFSSPQPTPLSTSHSLSASPSDDSVGSNARDPDHGRGRGPTRPCEESAVEPLSEETRRSEGQRAAAPRSSPDTATLDLRLRDFLDHVVHTDSVTLPRGTRQGPLDVRFYRRVKWVQSRPHREDVEP